MLSPQIFLLNTLITIYIISNLRSNKAFEVKIKPANQSGKNNKTKDLDIFVNPGTGEINGARQPDTGILYWVTKFHTNLMAGKVGRFFVGTFGLALLFMLVAGLMIYGSFMKKKRMTQIRYGQGTRKVYADWHKLLGITSVPFNLIWAGYRNHPCIFTRHTKHRWQTRRNFC